MATERKTHKTNGQNLKYLGIRPQNRKKETIAPSATQWRRCIAKEKNNHNN